MFYLKHKLYIKNILCLVLGSSMIFYALNFFSFYTKQLNLNYLISNDILIDRKNPTKLFIGFVD